VVGGVDGRNRKEGVQFSDALRDLMGRMCGSVSEFGTFGIQIHEYI
jgi:hypothetical protein